MLITKVRSYVRTKDNKETSMVCINDSVHLSLKQLVGVGYSNPKALIGSTINVEYFKKDEVMLNNTKCTVDDTIVKNFDIEDSAMDLQFAKMANAGVSFKFN